MSGASFVRFAPAAGGGVESHLSPDVRAVLLELCDQLERLVRTEDPASDPAVARLFPAAYPDDPLRELEYERSTGGDLAAGRLEALERMRATIDADPLDEGAAVAWLRTINDLRLVLGSRLDVEETTEPDDFADDPAGARSFDLYLTLGEVQALLLRALDPAAMEPPGALDPPDPGPERDGPPG